jgi:hypothetical protein
MSALAVRKVSIEKDYRKIVEEREAMKIKLDRIEEKINLLAGHILEVEKAGLELGEKYNRLDKIVWQKLKEKSELNKRGVNLW